MLGNDRVMADLHLDQLDGEEFRSELKALRGEGYRINKYGEIQRGPKIVEHILTEVAPRYADRTGGYTRIIKLGKHRIGDGADLCVLQLVGEEEEGPTVSGSFSRRREKANKRMEFAAKLRKDKKDGGKADEKPADEAAPADEADTAVADAPEAADASTDE